jgi:hypothetical protein
MVQSNIYGKNRLIKITLILIFGFFAVILLTTYPTVDDFIFSNISNAVRAGNVGHFDVGFDKVPGFTASIIILYEVCKIPYEILLTLPLLLIPFVLVFLAILKRSGGYVYPLIAVVCLLHFCKHPVLFCHTIGLLMLLIIVFLAFLRMENTNQQFSISVLIIIMFISLNFMSYKLTAFSIFFVSFLYIIELYEKKFVVQSDAHSDIIRYRFGTLALICLTFVLSFNQFFYKSFIPTLQKFESPFLGIERIFSRFMTNQIYDPLSVYFYKGEMGHASLYITWMAIIGILLIICIVVIFKKIILRENLSINEKTILSFGAAACFIFIIYTRLGKAEIGYILLTGLLGCGVLLTIDSKRCRFFANSSVFLLFLLSISMFILASDYGGQKDMGHFRYLMSPAKWYVSHAKYAEDVYPNTYTDVLTSGYFLKVALSENEQKAYRPAVFSSKELLFLLEPYENPLHTEESENFYIINYKERRFAIMGWDTINSWSKYKHKINSNPYLNIMYSSGWIDICTNSL